MDLGTGRRVLAVVGATLFLLLSFVGMGRAALAAGTTPAPLADCLNYPHGDVNCDSYAQLSDGTTGQPVGGRVPAATESVSTTSEAQGQLVTITLTNLLTPSQQDYGIVGDQSPYWWGMFGVDLTLNGAVVSESPASNADVVFQDNASGNPGQPASESTVTWEASGMANNICCSDEATTSFAPGETFSVTFKVTDTAYNPYPYEAFWSAFGGAEPFSGNHVGWAGVSPSIRVVPVGTTPPVAHMNYSPDGRALNEFTFDGSPSTAGEGATISKYHWDFGDGTTADTVAPTTTVVHRFTSEGDKPVKLTVTDSLGQTASDTETLGPSLRVEQIQFDPTVVRPHTAVRAAVTLQNDGTSTIHNVIASLASNQPNVAAPGSPDPAAQDIGPAQSEVFDFPVQAGVDGRPVLTIGGQGTTASGQTVSAPTKQFTGTVGDPGLLVDLSGEQPNPNDDFQVKVTLTNPGADPITGITYNDPSGVLEEDVAPAKSVATMVQPSDPPPTVLQPGESVPLTYAFHAGSDGSAVFTTTATGTTTDPTTGSTRTVTDTTSMSVTVTDRTPTPAGLDSAAQAAWDAAGQILASAYQNEQNILGDALTQTGLATPSEADYEAIRETGLSPGLAALAQKPTGLNAFGQGYSDEAHKLTNKAAAAIGQDLLTAYTAAKDPQTWEAMASAAYQKMQTLPASVLQNAGYLGTAVMAANTPQGLAVGITDTAKAATAASTSLQTTANNAANNLTNEILANRSLARTNPDAYYQKLGGYAADAEVATAGAAINLAVGDAAVSTAGKGLSVLASRVSLGAMVNSASGAEATIAAAAASADGEAGSVAMAQAAADGTGAGSTGLTALDGAVSKFQQLEAGGVISTTDASTLAGVLPSDAQKINQVIANVKSKYNVQLEVGVRTSEPLSLGLDVTPKPEIIKPKAVSVLDQMMGAPADAAGQSTVFNPVPLSADQLAAYEAQSPGFTAAYTSRFEAQKTLYDDYVNGKTNLSTLVQASKANPDGVTAIVGRPQPLGQFVMPGNLAYVEQLDDPAYLAANNLSASYAQGLKQQILQSYPDLMKVKIETVTHPDGAVTFIDGLKNRPYGSDLDVQYVRPANGADWPAGLRGQIETDVNSQFKQLSRYPNHGWSDAAADLNSAYYSAAAKFQMANVDPAVAGIQAQAILVRYQLTAQILERQSQQLIAQAALTADPTQKALLLAQAASLHKSSLKMAGTSLQDILAYGSGEKILVFTGGDIRVGYTPLLTPNVKPLARAVSAQGRTTVAAPTTIFTVTSLADSPAAGDGACESGGAGCTLREALAEASGSQLPTTVDLPAGTIHLTAGPLEATGASLTLVGAGTTIDGGNRSTLIQTTGGTLAISGITLTNGTSGGDNALPGGAISADGTQVSLTDATVSHDNSDEPGGGVFVSDGGALTLLRTTFTDDFGSLGGAVAVADSALSVTDSTFTGNGAAEDGGAIHAADLPALAISGSTFTDNIAGQRGGGLFVDGAEAVVTLTDDTFSGNTAGAEGGAVDALGLVSTHLAQETLSITGGSFENNTGRAGGALGSDDAPVTISGARFSANTADLTDGGAIVASGPLTVSGSTFTGNTATGDGGAIAAGNLAAISGSTFHQNGAGGLGGALALLGPGADTLTGGALSADSGTAGATEVWRDGGSLATNDALGAGLLATKDGQVVVAAASHPTATPASAHPATATAAGSGVLPFTGASVVGLVEVGAGLILAGVMVIGMGRRRRF
ncbi:MAG TPA: PKD domain-containing protein [Acidimicrobiales bacterium]|jgi:CSLREA domain-containing protein|nr:PKD domain-containing protein [Acidimicrobiales bacterium]